MTESIDIMLTLDDIFSGNDNNGIPYPMMVPQQRSAEFLRAQQLMRLERKLFGAWCQFLFRPPMQAPAILAKLFQSNSTEIGISQDQQQFEAVLDEVETELAVSLNHAWFLPYDHPTIVDLQFISHVERMIASCLYWKGLNIRHNQRWKHLNRWIQAFEMRTTYANTRSDYYTHVHNIPPQYGPPFPIDSDTTRKMQNVIDGKDGWWSLDTVVNKIDERNIYEPVPDNEMELGGKAACLEASQRLSRNEEHFDAVVKFACRGAGKRGHKSFAAELADPYAVSNDNCHNSTKELLKIIDELLISGCAVDYVDAQIPEEEAIVASIAQSRQHVNEVISSASVKSSDLVSCMIYLRDRIGVPRDMGHYAALMLRAHINFVLDIIYTS